MACRRIVSKKKKQVRTEKNNVGGINMRMGRFVMTKRGILSILSATFVQQRDLI